MLPRRPPRPSASELETLVAPSRADAPRRPLSRRPRAKLHSDLTLRAADIETIVRDALETIDVEPDEPSIWSIEVSAPAIAPPEEISFRVPLPEPTSDEFFHLETTTRIASQAPVHGRTLAMTAPALPQPEAPHFSLSPAYRSMRFAPTLDAHPDDAFEDRLPLPAPPSPTSPPPRRGAPGPIDFSSHPPMPLAPRPVAPARPAPVDAARRLQTSKPRRRSAVPYVLLTIATAFGVALWQEPEARHQVVSTANIVAKRARAGISSLRHGESSPAPAEASAATTGTERDARSGPVLVEASWQPSAANVAWSADPSALLDVGAARAAKAATHATQATPPPHAVQALPPPHATQTPPARPPKTRPASAPPAAEDDDAVDVARQAKAHLDDTLNR
jgi:hypothetical protein